MKNLSFMTLFLFSCSTFHQAENNPREIASFRMQNVRFEMSLSQDKIFANGADSVELKLLIKNAEGTIQEVNPDDLKLISDISITPTKFKFAQGVYSIEIKPKVKSPDIKLVVIWKDQVSPVIELKTTLAPMKDELIPLEQGASNSSWESGLYYGRNDNFPENQFEGFKVDNSGNNVIVNAPESSRSFEFEFEEQARQNISLFIGDAPNGTVSHTMHSLFVFFPRKVMPHAEINNKEVTVTLPTGEQMMFAPSGEIKGGVFTEGPVDVGPDRFKRTYANLKYQGKGILLRANARGQMPQQGQFEATKIDMEYGIKYSADVLIINGTTGQRCRRPKIDFWSAADVSPIQFKFPTDQEFDTYLKAKCNFGIPEMADAPVEPEEDPSETIADVWDKCSQDSDIKKCIAVEADLIQNPNTKSRTIFALELALIKAKAEEKLIINETIGKEVISIRAALLSEATWVNQQTCLEKSQSLVRGSFKFHSLPDLIIPSLLISCSTIPAEMDLIAADEVVTFKEKLEASFEWATVSTKERLIADCQKQALTFITPEQRYHLSPSIYLPAFKAICTNVEASDPYKDWIKTQGAGLEEKVFAQLLIDVEARAENQATKCLQDYPMDTQLNRMRYKRQRESCLIDNWYALEAEALKEAKRDPLVIRVELPFENIETKIAMERRRLQLKVMKKHFL